MRCFTGFCQFSQNIFMNLFLPHQARKDTDKEKTHAAKNEILQAEHHKVDKNE